MGHSYSANYLHVTFHTARNTPFVPAVLLSDLFEYCGGILRSLSSPSVEVGGMPDHLHLLFRCSNSRSASDIVGRVKANASRWLKTRGVQGFTWQTGYASFSVSARALERVTLYIRQQEVHHGRLSYREEVERLFAAYGLDGATRFLDE